MSRLIEALKLAVPLIKEMMLVDCIIELADATKTVVAVSRGKVLDFDIKVGDQLNPGGVAEVALQSGKRQILERDSSAFGKPYIAVANPIFEDGRIVGVITVGYSTAQREHLQMISESLYAFVQQFSSTLEQVASTSQQLADSSTKVLQQTADIDMRVQETEKIIDSVKNISKQTRILGINASIEANRVGIQGRGFAVVAGEIQRLASHTQESAKTIESTLNTIKEVFFQSKQGL